MVALPQNFWPSARHYAEAMQFPSFCFSIPELRNSQPAVDRLGMPLVTSGQFAYVYKLKSNGSGAFAVRCFRGYLGDREARYKAIDKHLETERIHALASFDYDTEGILVGGKWFPILVMEWVDGPTLDVYLEEVIDKPDVIKHIAEQWLSLIAELKKANVAHGDLQHGNIIVERGRLRLVDLDGIYVPAMKGWNASEVGHQHYQHPKRDEKFFNFYLDNFSSLVIYLSLISIAAKPSLWKKYHDENLLFIKNDFRAPEKSPLFREIKEISEEHCRLAKVLEQASKDLPFLTPSLLDLVEVKEESNLPLWMTAPPEIDVEAKTREDKTIVLPKPRQKGMPAWTTWQGGDPTFMPSGIGSNTVQTIYGSAALKPTDPKAIFSNTFFYANEIVSKKIDFAIVAFATVIWFGSMCFSPWAFFFVPLLASSLLLGTGFVKAFEDYRGYGALQTSSQLVPTPNQNIIQQPKSFSLIFAKHLLKESWKALLFSLPVAVFLFFIIGIRSMLPFLILFFTFIAKAWAEANAEYDAQKSIMPASLSANQLSASGYQSNPAPLPSQAIAQQNWNKQSLLHSTQIQSVSNTQTIIGNVMFGIYHKEKCEWVNKIPPGRRARFDSVDEAEEKNYNPCHVCFPQEMPKEKKKETVAKKKDADKTKTQTSLLLSQTSETQTAPQPTSPKPVAMFVGNRLLGIYHKPECEWAKKIPKGKLINFYTEDEAKKEKYRDCHVCLPLKEVGE